MEEKWRALKSGMSEAAEEVLGRHVRMERSDWFDVEAQEAIQSRNEARGKMLSRVTRESVRNYKEKRKVANKGGKKEKQRPRNWSRCKRILA